MKTQIITWIVLSVQANHSTSTFITLSNSSDHSIAVELFIWYCKIKQKARKSSGDPCSIIWLECYDSDFFHLHVDSDSDEESDDEAGGELADEFDAEDSSDDDDGDEEVGIDRTLFSELELEQMLNIHAIFYYNIIIQLQMKLLHWI